MKTYFCENCGCQLNIDDRFCENCGRPVPTDISENAKKSTIYSTDSLYKSGNLNKQDSIVQSSKNDGDDVISFFSREGWKSRWNDAAHKYGNENLGIIIINKSGSAENSSNYNDFVQSLTKYVAFRQEHGIYYFVLDVETQIVFTRGNAFISSKSIINILKEVYRVAKPKYLLLVGDEETIGAVKWESEAYIAPAPMPSSCRRKGDSDRFVDSDLPYLTLDSESPWSGQQWQDYSFEQCVRVGRIPCRTKNACIEAVTYFEKAIYLDKQKRDLYSFALSAQKWEETTKTIYHPFGNKVFTSPNFTVKDFLGDGLQRLSEGTEPNLLFFNLHGSAQDNYWYGEYLGYYPEAFSQNCLPSGERGYVIGSEACYGAKPNDYNSILTNAFQRGCLAFCGSTQIAYGCGDGNCCCADILVGEWIKKVADGYTFGDAYIAALKRLCQSDLDPETIKTLAEFSLYGDPSLSLVGVKSSVLKSFGRKSLPLQKGIHIPMPDVRKAVRLKLAMVNEAIEAKLNQYVERYQKDFADTNPYFCEVRGCNSYQAVYSKDFGVITKIMKVYFDKNGNVRNVYISK